MPIEGEYLGMPLAISDLDKENRAYFEFCAQGEFRLQQGRSSGLLRYPPSTACPWSRDREYDWVPVEGKGAVHSYTEVHHAIQPAFRAHTPYLILLVDLDTQLGEPTEHEALRVAGNLVTADGELAPPELVEQVGIGTRVTMVLVPAGGSTTGGSAEGFDHGPPLAIPNWMIDTDADQPADVWRYPD
ncbi:MAG: hypothetical protein GY773_15355 [Actinomycetia bacterium]|nr:hypothetical protein [Actinomycetes bacterium]